MAVPAEITVDQKYNLVFDGNVIDTIEILKVPDKYTLWVQEERSGERRLFNRYLFEVGLEDGTICAIDRDASTGI